MNELRRRWIPRVFMLIALATVARTICADDTEAVKVRDLLKELPKWPLVSVSSAEEQRMKAALMETAATIEKEVNKLDKVELAQIRKGIELYEIDPDYRPEKAYIVIQYVFEIPDEADVNAKKLVPAYNPIIREGVILSPSWPWVKRKDGTLEFALNVNGIRRIGAPYRALDVFDKYSREFGRRKTPSPW